VFGEYRQENDIPSKVKLLNFKRQRKSVKNEYPSLPDHTKLSLQIWDIAGQKAFKGVHPSYYRGAEGALAVCDVTRKETLENTSNWLAGLYKVVGDVPVLLLVNKYDLRAQATFSEREVNAVAARYKTPYYLTSAKTGHNVEVAFRTLAEIIMGLK